jgi:hypothetical protein
MAITAGAAVAGLAALGAGVPAVMAGVHTVPASASPPGWPAAKTAHMRAENQPREQAGSRPLAPPPAMAPALTPQDAGPDSSSTAGSQSALTQGVLPLTAGGPFTPSQFLGTNLWNGPVGGDWEVVQAGGVPADRALGAASPTVAGLFVYTRSPDPASSAAPKVTGVRVPGPRPSGEFTVRKATGGVLTLTLSGSGQKYFFNVATLRFTQ